MGYAKEELSAKEPSREELVKTEIRHVFALTEKDTGPGTVERLLTRERLLRKSLDELERIYFLDASVFAGINMLANHISVGYLLEDCDTATREKVRSFLKSISFTSKLNRLVRHTLIFGSGYGEIVYNRLTPPTKIVDIVTIDPKTIDLIRDPATGIPLFDDEGNFKGYIQKTVQGEEKKFTEVDVSKGHWPKILHFTMYPLSEGQRGIGLIEPLHKVEKIKLNLEHSFGEVAYRIGLPIIWAKIGDEFHHPTDDQLKAFGDQLKGIHTKNQIVTDNTVTIDLIQPKDISPLQEVLNYFKGQVCAGLGIPELLLYGGGAGVNRATATSLLEQFYRGIVTYQAAVAETVQLLINKYCELEKIKKVPKFGFKDPRPQILNDFAVRLERYAKAGWLSPTKAREAYLAEIEGLPPLSIEKASEEGKPEEELKAPLTESNTIGRDLADEIEKSYLDILEETKGALKKYGK